MKRAMELVKTSESPQPQTVTANRWATIGDKVCRKTFSSCGDYVGHCELIDGHDGTCREHESEHH